MLKACAVVVVADECPVNTHQIVRGGIERSDYSQCIECEAK